MSMPTRAQRLVGGIVAYRDGARVARAIRSLRSQRLPKGATWAKIWVVVAPDSEGTLEHARRAAAGDPRIEILEESDRRGKAAALSEIFRRASGDLLVLLNGDAEAEPGAVARMLRAATGARAPYGVMARPTVPPGREGAMYRAYQLLWGLHHRLHAEMYSRGDPTHLSDELLALSIERLPPIGPGVVNDGAHLATWIHTQGGELRYAESARVRLSLPARLADHIAQRRRIFVGHRQVYGAVALPEATMIGLASQDPACAARLIWSEARQTPHGFRSLVILLCSEAVAQALGTWDRARGTTDYAVWPRIALSAVEVAADVSPRRVPG
jgi:hypothetical protein